MFAATARDSAGVLRPHIAAGRAGGRACRRRARDAGKHSGRPSPRCLPAQSPRPALAETPVDSLPGPPPGEEQAAK